MIPVNLDLPEDVHEVILDKAARERVHFGEIARRLIAAGLDAEGRYAPKG